MLLREYIKARLVETCILPDEVYRGLDQAVAASNFWLEDNLDNASYYSSVPHAGEYNQTPAALALQDALQAVVDKAGLKIIFVVQSADALTNPKLVFDPDHRSYPDGIVVGGYATVTKNGRQAVILNMGVYTEEFDPSKFNPTRAVRKIGGIIRHELVHFKQCERRAEDRGISRSKAFKAFQNDPKAIPDRDAKKYWDVYEPTGEIDDETEEEVIRREGFRKDVYNHDYFSSYIEIDAHASQAADELLSLMGTEAAREAILKKTSWEDLGVDLPQPIDEYFVNNTDDRLMKKFRKKVLKYIEMLASRGLYDETSEIRSEGRDRHTVLRVNGLSIAVELADCDSSRRRGLMNRQFLDENSGMLFVFSRSEHRSFWMKETYLPLSIAYLDECGSIINIEKMAPLNLSSTRSARPAKYALEMNEGWFERNDIRPGDTINIATSLHEGYMSKLTIRNYIRELLRETLVSHSNEPVVGDQVVNTNPKCKHYGSEGVVLAIKSRDGDAGKTVSYRCTNDGKSWDPGEVLTKTMDQLDRG